MFTVLGLARIRGAAALSLLCVFLFQLCYSAAPVYLSQVMANNPAPEEAARAIVTFLVLYFLPNPITYVAALLRVLWLVGARRAFYEAVYRRTFRRIPLASSREAEKSFATIVSASGQQLLEDCFFFANGSASLLFSSLLSVTFISVFVLRDFVFAYLVSAALCGLIIWKLGPWQVRVAAALEKSYNKFISALPDGWLANSLGDAAVMTDYRKIFARRWRVNGRLALTAANAFRSFDLLQAICIWAPASIVILIALQSMSASGMIALAVVLPRLTETLLDISGLVSNLTDYLALKGRVAWLNNALIEREVDLAGRIDLRKLHLKRKENGQWQEQPFTSVEDLAALCRGAGRFAITGPNGSGKTSVMLLLKSVFGEQAIYLPAQAFLFPVISARLSTGQRKLRELRRTLALPRETHHVLLLDEWDANLDPANCEALSLRLDELSQTLMIIEVSHRQSKLTAPDPLTS
ncbi:hypothetical protein [Aestuariivirga sp.]|uniref:hypothetical protein n=1 Tax=Aestuariivirga sp. TaxID=2650926 RepID=UPI003BAD6754